MLQKSYLFLKTIKRSKSGLIVGNFLLSEAMYFLEKENNQP